jgi:hypothetical protein
MANKRKAVKRAGRKPGRSSAKPKARKPAAAHKPADEGFFASFLKLFGSPETKGKKA